MTSTFTPFLLFIVVFVLLPTSTFAFGAGDIPDFAYLNDKAFRHGDIENILENLVKHVGGAAIGGGSLLGFASSVLKAATGGSKFSKSDVKRVYFGNWLRDYSQAMDIAGLSKLSADTIILILSVLGFMTFGFATEEFEITQDRLGVYLPVEHIDNPKGYAETEGDARQIHPKLRPPVDPRELDIDERTGMKNYMATENEGWDTSTSFIRRTLKECIEYGRRAGGHDGADLWEAFRLLGTGLHTLEDLLAHSNWCEVALRKMGHEEVFCHVGDNVIINTPNGPAPPLVTGTFGGADFLHSLLGEAGDKLSQASVTDLSNKMDQASQGGESNVDAFRAILGKLPIGGNDQKMSQSEEIHKQSKAYRFDPDNIAPPEVQRQLLDLLRWRDNIMRDIMKAIEMVPGLSDLVDEFTNALNAYVYTILAPYVVPMITQASGILDEGSRAVINNQDQYQVFDDSNASDPSHSLLSKDHFALILNEPAGKIAQVVVEHTVNLIVRAWSDNSNLDSVLDIILEAFHHPYYATGRSEIQHKMFERMEMWLGGLGPDEARQIIQALTKESVREHKNKRIGSEDMDFEEPGYGGHSHSAPSYRLQTTQSHETSNRYSNSNTDNTPPGAYSSNAYSGGSFEYGETRRYESQSQSRQEYTPGGHQGRHRHDDENQTYGGGHPQDSNYRGGGYSQQGHDSSGYGRSNELYSGGYRQEDTQPRSSDYSREEYRTGRQEGRDYGRQEGGSYERQEGGGYGYQGGVSYGRQGSGDDGNQESEGYGRQRRGDDENRSYGSGHKQEFRSGGHSHSSRHDDDEGTGYSRRRDEEDNRFGTGESMHGRSGEYQEGYSRRTDDDGDNSGRSRHHHAGNALSYGQDKGSENFSRRHEGGDSYGRGGDYSGSGYNPSYGNDETYGAERLNIRDDDSDGSHQEKKHHGHRHRRNDSD